MPKLIVAAAQAAPVFLDRAATVEKACALVREARARGVRLLAFPEAFVPAYPDWVWTVPAKDKKLLSALYGELLAQAVTIPSDAVDRLADEARQARMHLVIGINELNADASRTSIFNSRSTASRDPSSASRRSPQNQLQRPRCAPANDVRRPRLTCPS